MSSIVDHITVLVDDLDESEKWYIAKLGAEVTHSQDNYRRLRLENTNIALLDRKFNPKPHIGILCEDISDLPQDGERIEHRDGTIGVYVEDNSGNYIEFIHYDVNCDISIK